MKKILFTAVAFLLLTFNAFSQQGQKYSVGGNNMSNGDILGSLNAVDVVITTNSVERFRFTSTGELKATAFSGNGTGLLQYDTSGTFFQLPFTQSVQDVLRGDGTWGSYSDGHWQLSGNDLYSIPTGNVGIGTIPAFNYKLDILGNVHVGGSLFADEMLISGLIKGSRIETDTVSTGRMMVDTSIRVANSIIIDGTNDRIYSTSGNIDFMSTNLSTTGTLTAGGLNVSSATFDSLKVINQITVGNSIVTSAFILNEIYTTNGPLFIQSNSEFTFNTIISNQKNSLVGIGTSSPAKKLHIKTRHNQTIPTSHMGIRLEDELYPPPPGGPLVQASKWDIEPITSTPISTLQFSSVLTNKTVMTMTENGNVGIGTTTPAAKVEIIQNDIFNPGLSITKEICAGSFCTIGIALEVKNTVLGNPIGTAFVVRDTGSVGIGTGNPLHALHVIGTGVFTTRLGIGITYPVATMHVVSTDTKIAEFMWDDTNAGATRPRLQIFGTPNKINLRTTYNTGGADLTFGTNTTPDAITIKENGQVYIGTKEITSGNHTNYKLAVDGKLVAKQMHTTLSNWSDYVLKKDYPLLLWEKQEEYYITEGHLFGVPSEKEVLKNGINLGEMDATLLRKLEESYLYIGELKKENKNQQKQIEELEKENKDQKSIYQALEERVKKLEN